MLIGDLIRISKNQTYVFLLSNGAIMMSCKRNILHDLAMMKLNLWHVLGTIEEEIKLKMII